MDRLAILYSRSHKFGKRARRHNQTKQLNNQGKVYYNSSLLTLLEISCPNHEGRKENQFQNKGDKPPHTSPTQPPAPAKPVSQEAAMQIRFLNEKDIQLQDLW